MEWISSRERDAIAVNASVLQIRDDLFFQLFCEWLAWVRRPSRLIVTTSASVDAATDEEYIPDAFPI